MGDPDVRYLSIKSLVGRKEPAARRAIILNWDRFEEADLELLREESSHFVEVAKRLLAAGSRSEQQLALTAIADLDLSDSMDVVLDTVNNPKHVLCKQATECLLKMCQRWGKRARDGKDIPSVRSGMLDKLSYHFATFNKNTNLILVDAWLSLVHWDDSAQRSLISDPRQPAYRIVLERLANSELPSVYQLLAGYLWRSATPRSVIDILTKRPDRQLAVEIAKMLEGRASTVAMKRLRQLSPLRCLEQLEQQPADPDPEINRRLWLMLSASSEDLAPVLRGALQLSSSGSAESRKVAAAMIRGCKRPDIESLIPEIQSADVEPNSKHHLGSLLEELVSWLNSPSVVLKKASEEFFQDFSLQNLLEKIRDWPAQMCKVMARFVAQVEPDVAEVLSRELQCPAPKRRMAALQATQMLDCGEQVGEALLPMLEDPRLEVRVRVIDCLSALAHETLDRMIPKLLNDASTDIQDAAGRAIRRRLRQRHAAMEQ